MTYDTLIAYVRKRSGQSIKTIGAQTTFKAEVEGEGLRVVTADGSEVPIKRTEIDSALETYNSSGSLTTTDYVKTIRCSSYLLALIRDVERWSIEENSSWVLV